MPPSVHIILYCVLREYLRLLEESISYDTDFRDARFLMFGIEDFVADIVYAEKDFTSKDLYLKKYLSKAANCRSATSEHRKGAPSLKARCNWQDFWALPGSHFHMKHQILFGYNRIN
jgi:hypothetical protein